MNKRRHFVEVAVPDQEKLAILSKSTLCRGMESADVRFIAPFFQTYHVEEKATIYEEGDVEAFMCLIVKGEVNIMKGRDKLVSTLGEGCTVGEMAIVDNLPRSATAVAKSEALVYTINRSSLSEIFNKSILTWANLFFNISVVLSHRLRIASDLMSQCTCPIDISLAAIKFPASQFHPFTRSSATTPS